MDCKVKIESGAGGAEPESWVAALFLMYILWAEKMGYETHIKGVQTGKHGGIKSIILIVKGKYAHTGLMPESGVHRFVRISPFDKHRRRHTSFASVSVCKLRGRFIARSDTQIRSYVLDPYKMVKNHRTGVETKDVHGVLMGNIEKA